MQNTHARAGCASTVQPGRATPDATGQSRPSDSLLEQPAQRAEVDGTGPSSDVPRRSSSDLARLSGDLDAVSKALGHSSVETTQAYLAGFDQTAVDDLVTVTHQRGEDIALAAPNCATAEISQTATDAVQYAGRRGESR